MPAQAEQVTQRTQAIAQRRSVSFNRQPPTAKLVGTTLRTHHIPICRFAVESEVEAQAEEVGIGEVDDEGFDQDLRRRVIDLGHETLHLGNDVVRPHHHDAIMLLHHLDDRVFLQRRWNQLQQRVGTQVVQPDEPGRRDPARLLVADDVDVLLLPVGDVGPLEEVVQRLLKRQFRETAP